MVSTFFTTTPLQDIGPIFVKYYGRQSNGKQILQEQHGYELTNFFIYH